MIAFPLIFEAFTTILRISPTKHVWTFDSTPELPHTLFSDIKKNPAFRDMVLAAQPAPAADTSKGKMKEISSDAPSALAWITNYLLSVNDVQSKDGSSGFSEALARVMSFCFSEAQNEPFETAARAAAAQAGCNVSLETTSRANNRHFWLFKASSILAKRALQRLFLQLRFMLPSLQMLRWPNERMSSGSPRSVSRKRLCR